MHIIFAVWDGSGAIISWLGTTGSGLFGGQPIGIKQFDGLGLYLFLSEKIRK
jgi:hypothetical protein